METSRIFSIIDGPSRGRLFDAFKYRHETIIPVNFSLALDPNEKTEFDIFVIDQISYEDNTGLYFALKGTCRASFENKGSKYVTYAALYNCSAKTGTMIFGA